MELVERRDGQRDGGRQQHPHPAVVTKGIITEVITGWAKLSPCPSPELEPGRAGGAAWEQSCGISAELWDIKAMQRNTSSTVQVPGGRSRIPGLAWRSRSRIPAQPPLPSSGPGLLQHLRGALLKAFPELAHPHPTSTPSPRPLVPLNQSWEAFPTPWEEKPSFSLRMQLINQPLLP